MSVAARFLRGVATVLRGRDLALYSAGLTFYAGIGVVPGVLICLGLCALLLGQGRVTELGDTLAETLPAGLGAPGAVRALVDAAVGMAPLTLLFCLFPASLYGEGLRRALVAVVGARDTFIGWRGRLLVLPLLVAGPALLAVILLVTPTVSRFYSDDGAGFLVGIVLAFVVDWLVLAVTLAWVYRVVGPERPRWMAVAWGALATASFVAGFVQGFVLFLSLPLDLGLPFGGLDVVGATVAIGLWLYLLHVMVLVGYALTTHIDGWTSQSGGRN